MSTVNLPDHVKETEKAFAYEADLFHCSLKKSKKALVWLPKSQVKDGQAPEWLVLRKMEDAINWAETNGISGPYQITFQDLTAYS
jgi:hypothetical protein